MRDLDRQVLTAELVEDVQRPEDLTIARPTMDKVVAPDVVSMLRSGEPHG